MARKARVEFEGAVYHVMDRGDRLEDIYRDDEDRRLFLSTLESACRRTGWRVHAYVLMSNHYHILLETPEANLVVGMRWLQGTYTIRHNVRHRLRGHLFQGRYKATLVDAENGGYFATVADYIHLNPVRAGLVARDTKLESYEWSSYPLVIGRPGRRPSWLSAERILLDCGSRDDAAGRRRYRDTLEERVHIERNGGVLPSEDLKALRRGWCFGGDEFRERAIKLLQGGQGKPRSGWTRSHHEAAAEEMINRMLAAFGLNAGDLATLAKSDPRKIAIAALIKGRTVVTNDWLGRKLHMGSPTRVSRYCNEVPGKETACHLKIASKAISKI